MVLHTMQLHVSTYLVFLDKPVRKRLGRALLKCVFFNPDISKVFFLMKTKGRKTAYNPCMLKLYAIPFIIFKESKLKNFLLPRIDFKVCQPLQ